MGEWRWAERMDIWALATMSTCAALGSVPSLSQLATPYVSLVMTVIGAQIGPRVILPLFRAATDQNATGHVARAGAALIGAVIAMWRIQIYVIEQLLRHAIATANRVVRTARRWTPKMLSLRMLQARQRSEVANPRTAVAPVEGSATGITATPQVEVLRQSKRSQGKRSTSDASSLSAVSDGAVASAMSSVGCVPTQEPAGQNPKARGETRHHSPCPAPTPCAYIIYVVERSCHISLRERKNIFIQ
jgi:hypothetical protein